MWFTSACLEAYLSSHWVHLNSVTSWIVFNYLNYPDNSFIISSLWLHLTHWQQTLFSCSISLSLGILISLQTLQQPSMTILDFTISSSILIVKKKNLFSQSPIEVQDLFWIFFIQLVRSLKMLLSTKEHDSRSVTGRNWRLTMLQSDMIFTTFSCLMQTWFCTMMRRSGSLGCSSICWKRRARCNSVFKQCFCQQCWLNNLKIYWPALSLYDN